MSRNMILGTGFVLGLLCHVNSHALSFINRCPFGDDECLRTSTIETLRKIAGGDSEIGISSLDPLKIKLIEKENNGFKFKFSDVITTGIKDCDIEKTSIGEKSFDLKILCKLELKGNYELNGQLLILPIEGKGSFNILGNRLYIRINGELNKKKGDDGRLYYKIESFKEETEALEPIVFRFENLYNGNEILSKATHDFANTNYKEILNEIGKPLLHDIYKKVVKIMNKIFTILPLDEAFLK